MLKYAVITTANTNVSATRGRRIHNHARRAIKIAANSRQPQKEEIVVFTCRWKSIMSDVAAARAVSPSLMGTVTNKHISPTSSHLVESALSIGAMTTEV